MPENTDPPAGAGGSPPPASAPSSASPAPRPSWETAPRPALPRPAVPLRPAAPPSAAAAPLPAAPPPAPLLPYGSPPPLDQEVKYDLAGNPLPSAAPPPLAAARPVPAAGAAVSPGAPAAAGVWPPPPSVGGAAGVWSGENGTDRVGRLKWNWGAFLIPFWWSVFNGQRNLAWMIFFIHLAEKYVPAPFGYLFNLADLGLMVYLGLMGHRLSWASGRFAGDYDNFIRTQRAWMIWGLALFGLGTIALIAAVALVPGLLQILLGGAAHSTHSYGGPASVPAPDAGNGASDAGSGSSNGAP